MIAMCIIMIYFDIHIWIYIDLNERVFTIVTDVIDSLMIHYSIYKQTWLNFNDEFMVP